uniref:ribonucleoside-diphosphate reductase n=1 Tax=Rhinella marina erythrocytic-like virus TaxID=2859906 RepID=A0A8F6YI13_9VIRU|nr:ribonucleotide reductase small subunit [Rhinella marina erythrocytic-like virus]
MVFKPSIEIVSKPDCIYCSLAKQLLTEKQCNWKESLKKPILKHTFPQIYVDDIFIGGYSDLIMCNELWELSMFKPSESYKPFLFPSVVDITDLHEKVHWVDAEISLTDDVMCWNSNLLSKDEKQYTIDILRLFTQSDVSVGNIYYDTFIPLFKNNELRCMMGSFAAREGIHQRAYAMLTDTLGVPDTIYRTFLEYTEMAEKMDFMSEMKTDTLDNIALSLVKAVFNEGVSLFASFLMLLNFQRFGKMTGMGKVVEWSIRDESLHVKGMTHIFKTLLACYPFLNRPKLVDLIYSLAKEALDLEFAFIDLVFKTSKNQPEGTLKIPQLNAIDTKNYIKFILDKRISDLGFTKLWPDLTDPTPWVTWIINGTDHTNFFDNKVTEYTVGGLAGTWDDVYDET